MAIEKELKLLSIENVTLLLSYKSFEEFSEIIRSGKVDKEAFNRKSIMSSFRSKKNTWEDVKSSEMFRTLKGKTIDNSFRCLILH